MRELRPWDLLRHSGRGKEARLAAAGRRRRKARDFKFFCRRGDSKSRSLWDERSSSEWKWGLLQTHTGTEGTKNAAQSS